MSRLECPLSVTGHLGVVLVLSSLVITTTARADYGKSGTNTLAIVSPLAVPQQVEVQARHITPSDLITLRDIGGYRGAISVSPSGDYVAFQIQQGDPETNRYQLEWFVASTAPNTREVFSLGDGGEVILTGEEIGRITGSRVDVRALWSPDSKWIAYRLKHGNEIQLWRSRWDGAVQEQLTHNPANVASFAWSADGTQIFFEVGRSRDSARVALEREGESGFFYDERFLPTYDTAPVFTQSQTADASGGGSPKKLWVYDIGRKDERIATPADVSVYEALSNRPSLRHLDERRVVRSITAFDEVGPVAWLENEDPLRFAGPEPPLVLYVLTVDRTERRCHEEECTGRVETPIWSRNGEEVYFIRKEGVNGLSRSFYSWDPQSGEVRRFLKTDAWITKCEGVADRLICLHESPTTPRKIVAIDALDGSISTVIDPNPEMQAVDFTEVEKLEWQEASGADAAGHLVYPANYVPGQRYPLVVVQYQSRGFLRGGTGNEYPIHPFAANGFFVLSFDRPTMPNVRAMIGDSFERERRYWGRDLWERSATLSALEIIVNQLDRRGLIDPGRVGITGLSDGAETVWYAMIHSTTFTAAAASSGGWSPSWYYQINSRMRRNILKRSAELLPPGTGGDDRWRRISPEFHAADINVPLLVQVADRELLLSAATIGALSDAGKPIEAYVYPGEYHIKWRPKHKLSVYKRSIEWFNFWLRGTEDSSPEKFSQYERWRELRLVHVANVEAAGETHSLPMSRAH